jgi:hypothetical protein
VLARIEVVKLGAVARMSGFAHPLIFIIIQGIPGCTKAKIYRPLPGSLSGRLLIETPNRTVMTTPSERTWKYRTALIGLAGS